MERILFHATEHASSKTLTYSQNRTADNLSEETWKGIVCSSVYKVVNHLYSGIVATKLLVSWSKNCAIPLK